MLLQKSQQAEQHLAQVIQERDMRGRDARGLQSELSRANNVIQNLHGKIDELQASQASFQQSSYSAPQQPRRVLQNNDLANRDEPQVAWLSQEPNEGRKVKPSFPQQDSAHSPFRRERDGKAKTPHPVGPRDGGRDDQLSPVKGRQDPNMPSYARLNMQAKQPQIAQLAQMSVQELLQHKQTVSHHLSLLISLSCSLNKSTRGSLSQSAERASKSASARRSSSSSSTPSRSRFTEPASSRTPNPFDIWITAHTSNC